jgi:hypothetical protein
MKTDKLYEYVYSHNTLVNSIWESFLKYVPEDKNISDYQKTVISQNLVNHDLSKLDICEAEGFSSWYFDESNDFEQYLYSVNKHHHKNTHHWEHWIVLNNSIPVPLKMPFSDIIEMLCNWSANIVSSTVRMTLSEWYEENKGVFMLHFKTVEIIEMYLEIFDKIIVNLLDTTN